MKMRDLKMFLNSEKEIYGFLKRMLKTEFAIYDVKKEELYLTVKGQKKAVKMLENEELKKTVMKASNITEAEFDERDQKLREYLKDK